MRYKSVVWDTMQQMFIKFNDHVLHSVIWFDSHIDEDCLKKAVSISANSFPIIKSRFVQDSSVRVPYWEECGFSADDMVKLVETDDIERKINKLIVYKIDEHKGPQLRVWIIRGRENDALCTVLNHMTADAGGFREYLYLLSSIYSALKENPDYVCSRKMGSRNMRQIFKRFSLKDRLKILTTSAQLSKYDNGSSIDFEGDNSNPFIVRHKISRDKFLFMKDFSKKNGGTVNDALLAVYVRALFKVFNMKRVPLPCPVDLRKYLPGKKTEGIANYISNMICDVECSSSDSFKDTLLKVKKCMDKEKDSFSCLNGPFMLQMAYDVLPYNLFKKTVYKSFSNPPLAMTNIGVIDKKKLVFKGMNVTDAFISGSIKFKPYFQIAVTTFDNEVTLTVNFHGTQNDKKKIENFLDAFEMQMPKED